MSSRSLACRIRYGFAVGLMALLSGCFGGEAALDAPPFDPDQVADSALSTYDSDTDGQLSAEELKAAPALLKSLDEIDTDQNGSLSKEELSVRVREIVNDDVGSVTVACVVLRGSKPIPGVNVRFVPEPFVADLISPASGVTGPSGIAVLASEDPMIPGVSAGFYKVELSLQQNGRELIKSKFNTKTTLGQEISFSSKELSEGPLKFEI